MSWPKTVMEPLSGRSRPLASFIRTDLPHPAGPRMTRVSPGATEKEMFSRTGLTSKMMETLSKTTTGPASVELGGAGSGARVGEEVMAVLPLAEGEEHGAADDEVDHDDEDR